ncbi:MAG: hypothetical protein AAB787_03070 [Patescibacteria group bacterium]
MFSTFVKDGYVEIEKKKFQIRYFQSMTVRGSRRFRLEVNIGPGDMIIRDGDFVEGLEVWVVRHLPFVLYSRTLT